MELSDNEEIVDLNDEKTKEEKKLEKTKSRTSSKNIKWIKSSLESISQIAKWKWIVIRKEKNLLN